MIPWVHAQTFTIGGITLQVWGTLVALGFLIGSEIAARKAKDHGLTRQQVWNMTVWILLASMIGARLFHVIFYEPTYYLNHWLAAFDPRAPGFSMVGGLLGAAGAVYFYTRRYSLNFVAAADTLVWGVPWGCGIGRIGCFLIHDHPGTLTNFMLGVRYPDGSIRHDLGLYLSLVGFATGGLFLLFRKTKKPAGFWVALFFLIEGISRLLLDNLRIADQRYFGFTPTQYLAVVMIIGSLTWFWRTQVCYNLNHDL